MFKKFGSYLSMAIVVAQPFISMATAQGSIQSGSQAASQFWSDFSGDLTYPETEGGTSFTIPSGSRDDGSTFGGGSVPIRDLFQADSQDTSQGNAYTLSDDDFVQLGLDERDKLSESNSVEGKAYDSLRESAYQSRPSMKNDPIFASSDAVYQILDGNGDAIQCTEPLNHEPVYKTCTRARKGFENRQSCTIEHDVEAYTEVFTVKTAAIAHYRHTIEFDLTTGSWTNIAPSDQQSYIHLTKSEIPTINYDDVCGPGADIDITLQEKKVWNGGYKDFWVKYSRSHRRWYEEPSCYETFGIDNRVKVDTSECKVVGQDSRYSELHSFNDRIYDYKDDGAYLIWYPGYMNGNILLSELRAMTTKEKNIDGSKYHPDNTYLHYGKVKEIDTTSNLHVLQMPSCSNGLRGKVQVNDNTEGSYKVSASLAGQFTFALQSIKKDEWKNTESCIPFAENERLDPTFTCESYFGTGPNVCGQAGQGSACPDDLGPAPIAGISNMCESIKVEYGNKPYVEGINNTCPAMESNPSCSFVSSKCLDGTPEEQVQRLYTYGLAKDPDSRYQYWVDRIKSGEPYDNVKDDFFDEADVTDGELVNEFSCVAFEETYDCGLPAGGSNSNACLMKDMFEDDFADCLEEMVPVEHVEVVRLEESATCEKVVGLSSCTVEREFDTVEKVDYANINRQCIIQEDVSIQMPWAADSVATSKVNVTNSGTNSEAQIIEQPSVLNDWTALIRITGPGQWTDIVEYRERTCGPGESAPCFDEVVVGEEVTCAQESNVNVSVEQIGYVVEVASVVDNPSEAENGPTCLRENDGITDVTWTCAQAEPFNFGSLAMSEEARKSIIPSLYPGEADSLGGQACRVAIATYDTSDFSHGEFCATEEDRLNGTCDSTNDSNGLQPGESTCAPLEQMAAEGTCRLVKSEPIGGIQGSTGIDYLIDYEYQCTIEEKEIVTTTYEKQYTCSGVVQCLGTECVEPMEEKSEDFSKAVAYLNALEASNDDISCETANDPTMETCRVFPGEAATCKQAIGGWVDCCETPDDVSLTEYITMLKEVGRLDNMIMNFNATSGAASIAQGSYAMLRDPIVNSVQYTQQLFTTAADNLTGGALNAGGEALKTSFTALQQTVLDASQKIVTEVFGESVANFFFTAGADGVVQLSGAITGALSFIGTLYTIYSIAKIIATIVWECSDDEFQLNVDRKLKKAHYVGSYCHDDSLFGCVEKRKSYCVFSSPLSRIVNREGRKQLGLSFGPRRSPDCSGILMSDLAVIDWEKMDLSEWTDILKITGNFPETDVNLEGLTGEAGYLGERQDEDRKDSVDRNVERLDGVDLDEKKQEAAEELWSSM